MRSGQIKSRLCEWAASFIVAGVSSAFQKAELGSAQASDASSIAQKDFLRLARLVAGFAINYGRLCFRQHLAHGRARIGRITSEMPSFPAQGLGIFISDGKSPKGADGEFNSMTHDAHG